VNHPGGWSLELAATAVAGVGSLTGIAPAGARDSARLVVPFSGGILLGAFFGGALSGGQVVKGPSDGKYNVLNGMLSIIIDPGKLGTGENLAREVESFVAWHTGSPPAPGVDKVKIAGEPERETKKKRLAEGIPVDPTTWQEILEAGKKFGLDQAAIEKIAG